MNNLPHLNKLLAAPKMSLRSQAPIAVVPPTRRTLFSAAKITRQKLPTARDFYSSSSGFREDSYENSESSSRDSSASEKKSREHKTRRGSSTRKSSKSNTTTISTPRSLDPGSRRASTSQSVPRSENIDSFKSNDNVASNYDICPTSKECTKTLSKQSNSGTRYGRSKSDQESRLNTASTSYPENLGSCSSLHSECRSNIRREIPLSSKRNSSLSGININSEGCSKTSSLSRTSCSPSNSSKIRSRNNSSHDCDTLELLRSSHLIEVPSKFCWADLPDHDVRILKTMARRRREQCTQEQIAHAFRELWREERETRVKELEYCASQYASWVEETRRTEAAKRAAARRTRIARERRETEAHADSHRQQHLQSEQRIQKLADDKACEMCSRAAEQHELAEAAAAARSAAELTNAARRREEEARLHKRCTRAAINRACHLDNLVDRVSAENAIAAEIGKRAREFRSSCARARARVARERADAVAARAQSVECGRRRAARDSIQMALLTAQLRDTIRTSDLFH